MHKDARLSAKLDTISPSRYSRQEENPWLLFELSAIADAKPWTS
jgi:hypothetical protein